LLRTSARLISCDAVQLFTAHASASLASHGQASVDAQSADHRAMEALHSQSRDTRPVGNIS
jgi:hypothetical protein